MEVVNPNLMFFPAAGLRVSFAITGRTCSRTDAVRPRAVGPGSNQLRRLRRSPEDGRPRPRQRRRTQSTSMARRGGCEHRVPLGDITNTYNRKTGSNKRSSELEGGEYCMTTYPCP